MGLIIQGTPSQGFFHHFPYETGSFNLPSAPYVLFVRFFLVEFSSTSLLETSKRCLMIKTNRTKKFLFEKNWNFSQSSGWRCVFFGRSYYLFIEEDEVFTSPAGWGQRGEMVQRNSQKVAISFRGHDKPRQMGVAIAIDPFQFFFLKLISLFCFNVESTPPKTRP